jgi:hypothetical protein
MCKKFIIKMCKNKIWNRKYDDYENIIMLFFCENIYCR